MSFLCYYCPTVAGFLHYSLCGLFAPSYSELYLFVFILLDSCLIVCRLPTVPSNLPKLVRPYCSSTFGTVLADFLRFRRPAEVAFVRTVRQPSGLFLSWFPLLLLRNPVVNYLSSYGILTQANLANYILLL